MKRCEKDLERVIELFIETLRNYFVARGKMIRSLMEVAGQDKVRIELPALFWYFPKDKDKVFKRFMDLYRYLRGETEGRIIIYGEVVELKEDHIVISRSLINKIMGGIGGKR